MAKLLTQTRKERVFTIELNEEEVNFLTGLTALDKYKLEELMKNRTFIYSSKSLILESLENETLYKLFSFFADILGYHP